MNTDTVTFEDAITAHEPANLSGALTGFANIQAFSDEGVAKASMSFDHEGGITQFAADGRFADSSLVDSIKLENDITAPAANEAIETSVTDYTANTAFSLS